MVVGAIMQRCLLGREEGGPSCLPYPKRCCLDREKDRLSLLPDPIRNHIVSFLPLKDAVRTSILSRQWENVCSSLSNMEFDQRDFRRNGCSIVHFKNVVDRLLFRHDRSEIRSFTLITAVDDVFITSSHVNAWISFALQHNVKHLQLWGYEGIFPRSFYTCSCRSLTELTLLDIHITFPSFVHFPMLKSFHLVQISFNGKNPINELVSNCTCPMLEELEINFCFLETIKSLSISNPGLKYLTLHDDSGITVNVSVPHLRALDCCVSRAPTISSETLMSLASAAFEYMVHLYEEEANDFLIINRKIVKGSLNVQKLILRDNFIELLSRDRDLVAHLASSGCNPKQLHLFMFRTNVNSQVTRLLLRGFTNLQSLCVYVRDSTEKPSYLNINKKEEYLEFKELPSTDVLTCLRTVEIIRFEGGEAELDLLRYLLQNAKHLEKITFRSSALEDGAENQLRTSELLSTFTRVAPNVAINWISRR